MNHPGGSQARAGADLPGSDAPGSCISRVEVRPRNATGTGSAGPARRCPAAEAASLMGVFCAGVAIGVPP